MKEKIDYLKKANLSVILNEEGATRIKNLSKNLYYRKKEKRGIYKIIHRRRVGIKTLIKTLETLEENIGEFFQKYVSFLSAKGTTYLYPFNKFGKLTREKVHLLSHLLFDGFITEDNYEIGYTSSVKKHLRHVGELINSIWNVNAEFYEGYLRFSNTIAALEMRYFLPVPSTRNKKAVIPDFIFSLKKDYLKEFMRAGFDDEGWLLIDGKYLRLGFTNKSEEIVDGMISLLSEFDIPANKRYNHKEDCWFLRICNQTDIDIFFEKIRFSPFQEIVKGKFKGMKYNELYEKYRIKDIVYKHISNVDNKIISYLKDKPFGAISSEIKNSIGIGSYSTLYHHLGELVKKGKIVKVQRSDSKRVFCLPKYKDNILLNAEISILEILQRASHSCLALLKITDITSISRYLNKLKDKKMIRKIENLWEITEKGLDTINTLRGM